MFFSSINQAIGMIGQSKFVNDQISLKLNENACLFLFKQGNFDRKYEKGYVPGYFYTKVEGLILKKDEKNSVGDEVNPEFIEGLKKITDCFLNFLTTNWIETKRESSILTISNSCKEAKKISIPDSILLQIASLYNLTNNLEIINTTSRFEITGRGTCVDIRGELNDVLRFSRILKWEAIQTHSEKRAITLLMCAKNGDECFSSNHIPKELIEKIINIVLLLILPNSIQNLK